MSALSDQQAVCADGHCITCADEAVEMIVMQLDGERGLALAQAANGSCHSVEIALVAPVAVGDVLLVHAGTAIALAGAGAPREAWT